MYRHENYGQVVGLTSKTPRRTPRLLDIRDIDAEAVRGTAELLRVALTDSAAVLLGSDLASLKDIATVALSAILETKVEIAVAVGGAGLDGHVVATLDVGAEGARVAVVGIAKLVAVPTDVRWVARLVSGFLGGIDVETLGITAGLVTVATASLTALLLRADLGGEIVSTVALAGVLDTEELVLGAEGGALLEGQVRVVLDLAGKGPVVEIVDVAVDVDVVADLCGGGRRDIVVVVVEGETAAGTTLLGGVARAGERTFALGHLAGGVGLSAVAFAAVFETKVLGIGTEGGAHLNGHVVGRRVVQVEGALIVDGSLVASLVGGGSVDGREEQEQRGSLEAGTSGRHREDRDSRRRLTPKGEALNLMASELKNNKNRWAGSAP